MQRRMRANLLACIEVPYRLHVAVADGLVVGKMQHPELDRVERIDPARSPGRTALRPSQVLALLQQALAHEGDEDEPIGYLVKPGQLDLGRHRRDQVMGVEAIVCRAAREETQVTLDIPVKD